MSEQIVREAHPSDIQAIRAVAERGWRAAYEDILRPETIDAAMEEWYDPELLRDSLERSDAAVYVAVEGAGTVNGFVRGSLGDEVGHLGAIYVDPEQWGEGIGSQLLTQFEQFCADHGYETIEFAVLAGNDIGRSFYRSQGYEQVEDREVELFGETVEDSRFRGPVE